MYIQNTIFNAIKSDHFCLRSSLTLLSFDWSREELKCQTQAKGIKLDLDLNHEQW
mgnify:CR=1 FL=1